MKRKYSDIISEAKSAAKRGEYDNAAVFLSKLPESYTWHCSELVFKAAIIQLCDEPKYSLKDAEESLNKALDIDPNNIEALVEMGHYQANVNDDESTGIKFFKKAEELCIQYLNEIKKELNQLELEIPTELSQGQPLK